MWNKKKCSEMKVIVIYLFQVEKSKAARKISKRTHALGSRVCADVRLLFVFVGVFMLGVKSLSYFNLILHHLHPKRIFKVILMLVQGEFGVTRTA